MPAPGETFATVYEVLTQADATADVRLQPLPAAATTTDAAAVPRLGRFRVLGELGRGGMGVVWEAEDPDLQRRVAVKVLSDRVALHPGGVEGFVVEARLTGQLDHPHIVPVHELGVTPEGQIFFVMKRVTGESLEAHLERLRQGTLRWSEHRRLVALQQLCQAVAFAHSRGVIHRDIKPGNVMVGPFGEILLMDWGIARVRGVASASRGRSLGTPGYMAPEVALGADGDERADIFALGALLYEVLTLQPAFPGATAHERLLAVRQTQPPPRGDLPAPLWATIAQALHPDPDARPASAGALSEAIEDYLDGSRRRAEALEMVQRARETAAHLQALQSRQTALLDEVADLITRTPPWSPIAQKYPLWDLREEDLALQRSIAQQEVALLEALRGALARCPDLTEALRMLADWFYQQHRLAEQRDDPVAAARADHELGLWDHEGRYRDYRQGDGRLILLTEPAGATVRLRRVVERRRRYEEEPAGEPLTTPIVDRPLGMGAWIAEVEAPGRAPVRVSLWIARGGVWDNVPPGAAAPQPIRLPRADVLGPDDVFIPGGWTQVGSARTQPSSHVAPQWVWVDDLILRRYAVTNREYLAFLNDLVVQGREAEALRWAPRSRPGAASGGLSGHSTAGELLYGRDPDGRFVLTPDPDGDLWLSDWPVMMINRHCAGACARHVAAQTGQPWRLPTELELERAGRGADGRETPYGNLIEPAWSLTASSFSGRRLPREVHDHPMDVSLYGVMGLSGNVQCWCMDLYRPTLNLDGQRAITPDAGRDEEIGEGQSYALRGGAFTLNDRTAYCASRCSSMPGHRGHYLGMRLARSATEDDF